MFNHARFYCNYQVFSENRPENRLILSALLKVSALTTITANNQLAIEMLPYFSQISESDNFHLDLQQWRTGPEMEDYRQLHSWCQLLLNCHPMLSSGEISAESIMFPMERLFEAYVQAIFKQQFKVPNYYCVNNTGLAGKPFYLASWQNDDADVLSDSDKDIFSLKPDIVVFNDQQPLLILDAKWKLLDDEKNQKSIKEADVYQMLAYAHALRPTSRNLCLIFPKSDRFKQPVIFKFMHLEGEQNYRVRVIPFDIATDEFIGVDNWQSLISVN